MSVRRRRREPVKRSRIERAAIAFCVRLNPHCPCEEQRSVCDAMVAATRSAARFLLDDDAYVALLDEERLAGTRLTEHDEMMGEIGTTLRPDATKLREATPRNGTGRTEPAFPAVNRVGT